MEIDEAIKIIEEKKGWEFDDIKIDAFIMAIEALKYHKEYEAKMKKCIERLKEMSGVQYDCDKCGTGWEINDCIYTENAIAIVREELEVQDNER